MGVILLFALFFFAPGVPEDRAHAYSVSCWNAGIGCVSNTGYSGRSVWGYPVDGQGNNCTNYAAYRLSKNGAANPGNLGNAGDWATNARAKGFRVDSTPKVGSIAQWSSTSSYAPGSGHVAYVEAVNGSTISLSDSNYKLTARSRGGSSRWTVTRGEGQYPNAFLHIKDVPTSSGSNPTGALDIASSPSPGSVRVAGWAFDRDSARTSIRIHVYIGGKAGTSAEGHDIGPANGKRTDVDRIHKVGSNHGFDKRISTKRVGSMPVCVYAINVGSGRNKLLACKQVTIRRPDASPTFPMLSGRDYNGDGRDDLAVLYRYGSMDTGINVFPGTASGLGSSILRPWRDKVSWAWDNSK